MTHQKWQWESQNSNWLNGENNNSAPASHILRCCRYTIMTWKCLISHFTEDVNQSFFLFLKFNMVLKNSTPGEFAGIIAIEIERMQIPFFAAVTVVVSWTPYWPNWISITSRKAFDFCWSYCSWGLNEDLLSDWNIYLRDLVGGFKFLSIQPTRIYEAKKEMSRKNSSRKRCQNSETTLATTILIPRDRSFIFQQVGWAGGIWVGACQKIWL